MMNQGSERRTETVDEIVQRLSDVEAITNLKASYFRYLDLQQWDDLSALFINDARFELETSGDPVVFDTVADWLHNLQRFLPGGWSVHHGHMPELHVSGDNATGIWAMYDQVHPGPQAGREPFEGFGHYHEEYRRVDAVWKIAALRLSRLWVGPVRG
jgi:SnoaL-like domain